MKQQIILLLSQPIFVLIALKVGMLTIRQQYSQNCHNRLTNEMMNYYDQLVLFTSSQSPH